ncbi:hypothetical protein E2K93_03265 [Thalassotalea sp. HSM 43]|uniref:hypothetical protein n=1 Tax=Thalassotalea sp. HSM 43 TaxID=2552945 RepID=UPI0010806E18|nr:hypothetical protein [Thalassotalea sp. HSM 43]QBY03452.1 hypothetical protein E2K93_03265 [Thalassotalea sp. HSM 43]
MTKKAAHLLGNILVVIILAYFALTALPKLEQFQWRATFLLPVTITVMIFIFTNFLGAIIWFILLIGRNDKIDIKQTIQIFFISQLGKYVPGNIAHLFGRVWFSRAIRIDTVNVVNTLVLEVVLLTLAVMTLSLFTLYQVGLQETIEKHLIQLDVLIYSSIFISVISLIVLRQIPSLFGVDSKLKFLRNLHFPKVKYLLICLILYWFTFLTVGFSLEYLADSIFDYQFENIILVAGIFSIAFITGYLTPGAPGGLV